MSCIQLVDTSASMESDSEDALLRHSHYDLVVVGSGSGGLGAAKTAAKNGARTLIVERLGRLGGDCTWYGCVPSKALIRCARACSEARRAHRFGVAGVDPARVGVDWPSVQRHVRGSQELIYRQDDSPEALAKDGVEAVLGQAASFVDAHTLALEPSSGTVTADRFVLCTGAGPSIPPIDGLEGVPFLTYETIFDIPALPDRLIVVGGGPIGSELAQAFARFGCRVTLVGTLLPREDEDVRAVIREAFLEDGVAFAEGRAQRVGAGASGQISLWTSSGERVEADALLIASGRRPRGLEALRLENAGVQYSAEGGIEVDSRFRTSARHIFAVGDCLGGLQFTHLAALQGGLAAFNAVALPVAGRPPDEDCPRCTFTHPEVASVGLAEDAAREAYGDELVVARRDARHVDRAVCEGETRGFIKVLHTRGGRILGATVVSPVAGETASELGVAIASGASMYSLGTTMHAYPTFSFGLFLEGAAFATGYLASLRSLRACCGPRLRGRLADV